MVTIPTPQAQGQPIGSVQQNAANTQGYTVRGVVADQPGRDLQQLGNVVSQTANLLQQRRDRVATREAQAAWYDFERAAVLDPNTGLYTVKNGNAAGITDTYENLAANKRKEIMDTFGAKMGASGREAAEMWLQGQEQALYNKTSRHELQELEAYEKAQIAGNIEHAADRATAYWNDNAEYMSAITEATLAAEDEAEGLDGKARAEHVQARTTQVGLARANAMLTKAPDGVEEFVKAEIEAGRIDPTEGQAWLDQNEGTILRGRAERVAYGGTDFSVTHPTADPVKGSPLKSFMARMGMSESSGDHSADRTNDDGRRFAGKYQFGEARLQDAIRAGAVPAGTTLDDLTQNKDGLGEAVAEWHFKDIDRVIDNEGFLDKGWSRDGLRAVAHLGGINGMKKFVMSGGTYNPADELGTSLKDYYDKFTAPPTGAARGTSQDRVQQLLDSSNPADVRLGVEAQKVLNEKNAAEEAARSREAREATDTIIKDFERAELNGEYFDLNEYLAAPGIIDTLGPKIDGIRDYIHKRKTKTPITTDLEVYGGLVNLKDNDPEAFKRVNLTDPDFLNNISDSDLKGLIKTQSEMRGTINATMSSEDEISKAIGTYVDSQIKGSDNRTQRKAQALNEIRDQVNTFEEQVGRKATDLERKSIAEKVQFGEDFGVVINPKGPGNEESGVGAAEIMEALDETTFEQLMAADTDFTLTVPSAAGPLQRTISAEERDQVFEELQLNIGRRPTSRDVMVALLIRYSDQFNP